MRSSVVVRFKHAKGSAAWALHYIAMLAGSDSLAFMSFSARTFSLTVKPRVRCFGPPCCPAQLKPALACDFEPFPSGVHNVRQLGPSRGRLSNCVGVIAFGFFVFANVCNRLAIGTNHRWKLGRSRYLYSMQLSTWCRTCELHFLAIEVAFPSGSEDAVFLDLRANARCVLSRVCSNGFVIISRSPKVSFSLFVNSQACQWRGVVAS